MLFFYVRFARLSGYDRAAPRVLRTGVALM